MLEVCGRRARTVWSLTGLRFVVLVLSCAFLCGLLVSHSLLDERRLGRNQAVFQAQALLDGRLDIPHDFHDMAVVDGRNYVIYPPLPSLLMLPAVAIWGDRTNTTVIGLALSVLSAMVLLSLLRRRGLSGIDALWLTLAFLFGTAYWFCQIKANEVYFLAHIVAVLCALTALWEFFGPRRLWLVGLLVGLAFLSRQLSIYLLVFFALALWSEQSLRPRWVLLRQWLLLGAGFAGCAIAMLVWNQLRFGDALETGYAYLQLPEFLQQRIDRYGLFSWHYLPHNAAYLLIQGLDIEFNAWTMEAGGMNPFGTSLTIASPFVVAAFWARENRRFQLAAWLAIGLCALHQMLYYNNGWSQINGQRFALDFLPLLLLLCASGVRQWPRSLWQALIVYAVGVNALALMIGRHQI